MPDARTLPSDDRDAAAPPESVVAEPDRPPSLAEIKASLVANHEVVSERLERRRRERDRLNDEIRVLVAEEAEAERILRSLEPRKTKKAVK